TLLELVRAVAFARGLVGNARGGLRERIVEARRERPVRSEEACRADRSRAEQEVPPRGRQPFVPYDEIGAELGERRRAQRARYVRACDHDDVPIPARGVRVHERGADLTTPDRLASDLDGAVPHADGEGEAALVGGAF